MSYENHTSTDSHLFLALIVGALVWVGAALAQPQAPLAEAATTVACVMPAGSNGSDAATDSGQPAAKTASHRS
jgi:hypothetical protein